MKKVATWIIRSKSEQCYPFYREITNRIVPIMRKMKKYSKSMEKFVILY